MCCEEEIKQKRRVECVCENGRKRMNEMEWK